MKRSYDYRTVTGTSLISNTVTQVIAVDPNALYLDDPLNANTGELFVSSADGTKRAKTSGVFMSDVALKTDLDHTLLANIGTRSHMTIDSDLDADRASISLLEANQNSSDLAFAAYQQVVALQQTDQDAAIQLNLTNSNSADAAFIAYQLANDASQTLQDSAITTLQGQSQKFNTSGEVLNTAGVPLTYTGAVSVLGPNQIPNRAYVDSKVFAIQNALRYCGVYDATTNTPDLINSGPYTQGCYHIVNVAGTQSLNGVPLTVDVGDWLVRGPTSWEVIEDNKTEIVDLQMQVDSNDLELSTLQSQTQQQSATATDTTFTGPILNNTAAVTLPNQVTTKAYVDSLSSSNFGLISTLQNQTQNLDVLGQQTANLLPTPTEVLTVGTPLQRWQNVHALDVTATNLRTSNLINATGDLALQLQDNATGSFILSGQNYVGTQGNLLNVDGAGVLQKSAVKVTPPGGVECKSVTCASIIGDAAGPSQDLSLHNQNGRGIVIADSGDICYTGSSYAGNGPLSKIGQFLKIDDSKGTLVAASLPPSVAGPVVATDDALARFDGTTGQLIQSSGVTLNDTGALSGVSGISLSLGASVGGPATVFEASYFRGNNPDPQLEVALVNQSNTGLVIKSDGTARLTSPAYQGAVGTLRVDAFGNITVLPDVVLPKLVTPALTSNTSPTFSVSSSSAAAFQPWVNFDGDLGSRFFFANSTAYNVPSGTATGLEAFEGVAGSWIRIDLDQVYAFNRWRFVGQAPAGNPYRAKGYALWGSLTGQAGSWSVIQSGTQVHTQAFLWEPYIPLGAQAFKHIVYQITSNDGSNYCVTHELEFSHS